MSLMDTIKAARQEAEEAGTLPTGKKANEAAKETTESESSSSSTGFSRRSAARAKPAREVAGSVRKDNGSKPDSEMTKEEKKAKKEADREVQDLVYDTKAALLNQMPEYKRSQRIWWGCLIAGIILTLISFLLSQYVKSTSADTAGPLAVASVMMMVAAYVLVIGAFIYDLVKVRPLRNAANDKMTTMSKKRMERFLKEEKSNAKK